MSYFDPLIVNNTIADNIADDGAGVYADANSNPAFWNTIIYFNDDWSNSPNDLGGNLNYDAGNSMYQSCDIRNLVNLPNNGNIPNNPNFSPLGNGYHLSYSASPCISVGDNSAPNITTEDMDGITWGYGGTIDIGCYENDNTYYFIVMTGTEEEDENIPLNNKINTGDFSLFPNPAYNTANLTYPDIPGFFRISIIDLAGKEILEVEIRNYKGQFPFDVSNLQPGVYFVRIFNKDKSLNKTLKLIKN